MNLADLIPPTYRIAAVLALAGALVAAGSVLGWLVNGWRLGAQVADVKAEASAQAAARASEATKALRAAVADRDAVRAQLADVDRTYLAKLEASQRETETIRLGVAGGARVVRVNGANCPARRVVPPASSAGSVDSGTGIELAPAVGSDILGIRAGIERLETKLAACQEASRAMTR